MAEYIKSICRNCYHSYVCERFNKYRDENNPDCHFANDHFVPAADVVEVVRCGKCKWSVPCREGLGCVNPTGGLTQNLLGKNDFCSGGERRSE